MSALPDPRIFAKTEASARAWRRVLDAVGEMRDALDYRIWREDAADTHLDADCRAGASSRGRLLTSSVPGGRREHCSI